MIRHVIYHLSHPLIFLFYTTPSLEISARSGLTFILKHCQNGEGCVLAMKHLALEIIFKVQVILTPCYHFINSDATFSSPIHPPCVASLLQLSHNYLFPLSLLPILTATHCNTPSLPYQAYEEYRYNAPIQLLVISIFRKLLECNYTRDAIIYKTDVLRIAFSITHRFMQSLEHVEVGVNCLLQCCRSGIVNR